MIHERYFGRGFLVVSASLVVWGALGAKLFSLHLGDNEDLRERARRMHQVQREVKAPRGRITDRTGTILAMDLVTQDVIADPMVIQDRGQVPFVSFHAARLLDLDRAALDSRLSRPGRRFEYVSRHVPRDRAEMVRDLDLVGLRFEPQLTRHYPLGHLASHVVGFTNLEGVGSLGVEQALDPRLRPVSGLVHLIRDGRGREVPGQRLVNLPERSGASVELTLDATIQHMVEQALDRGMEDFNARGAWAVVLSVRTGEVLAMASRPGFDLNRFRASSPEERMNRVIGYTYEPGSTFKAATLALALDHGVVRPDDVFFCEHGRWFYGGRSLRDYSPHGDLTVADIIQKSSNIGTAKVLLRLGPERLYQGLLGFGVARPTGIRLPAEESGVLAPPAGWSGISLTRIAIGHETTVTALQIATMMNAIANDGLVVRPQILRRVVDDAGRELERFEPELAGRAIRPDTAALMRHLLARVTEPGGTATRARVPGYRVAGKTGTAQKVIDGRYSDRLNIASFVGFLPVDRPEVTIAVVLDEPGPVHRTGGRVAAPLFAQIAEPLMRYLDVVPDPEPATASARAVRPPGAGW